MRIRFRTAVSFIILFAFLLSLSVYSAATLHRSDRIFFFPDHQSRNVTGERRSIPSYMFRREKNITVFVEELLLGPLNMKLDPLFSSGTKQEKVLYRNGIVYLDLNFKALLPDKKAIHGFDYGTGLLEKNIRFNFPSVKKVVITVLGQEPDKMVTE